MIYTQVRSKQELVFGETSGNGYHITCLLPQIVIIKHMKS